MYSPSKKGDELFLISDQMVTPRSKTPKAAVVASFSYTAGNWFILALICSSPWPVLFISAVPRRQTSTEHNTLWEHPSCKLNRVFDILAKIPTVDHNQWKQPSLVSTKSLGNRSQHQTHWAHHWPLSIKLCVSVRSGLSTVNPPSQ